MVGLLALGRQLGVHQVLQLVGFDFAVDDGLEAVDEKFQPIPGSEFELRADLVLLAMGFVAPIAEGMLADAEVKLDPRGNVAADMVAYKSSVDNIYACGDMRRGQSLVVWAIREGRQAAHSVDKQLMGKTTLPR